MTSIYFMRHSETMKFNNVLNNDDLNLQNEKWPLTINGENIAYEKSLKDEFKSFDVVYSSNYVRAVSTAKYFTNDMINIDSGFNERKFGINFWEELPNDFYEKQFRDFDYKLSKGESLNEVLIREEISLNRILDEHKNQKILIVGHSTALMTLFSKWCQVYYDKPYKFNEQEFFDGFWNYCETFKLIFDENKKLVNIENIK